MSTKSRAGPGEYAKGWYDAKSVTVEEQGTEFFYIEWATEMWIIADKESCVKLTDNE